MNYKELIENDLMTKEILPPIVPNQLMHHELLVDTIKRTITLEHTPSKSPAYKKRHTLNDYEGKSKKSLFQESNVPSVSENTYDGDEDDTVNIRHEIITMLPSVLEYLKSENQSDVFLIEMVLQKI